MVKETEKWTVPVTCLALTVTEMNTGFDLRHSDS